MKTKTLAPLAYILPGFLILTACSDAQPTRKDPQTAVAPNRQSSQDADAVSEEEGTEEDQTDADVTPVAKVPAPKTPETPAPAAPLVFTISSSGFQNNQPFPALYVAKGGGGNQSPPLEWKGAPAGTGSFAIQMVDLDFGTPPLIHWSITNIPATTSKLPTAIPKVAQVTTPAEAMGAMQVKTYGGPNPPNLHRYEITIYAIKQGETVTLVNNSTTNKTQLEAKSLAKSVIIGTYQ